MTSYTKTLSEVILLVKTLTTLADEIRYHNVEYQVQRTLWLALRASSSVLALTKNILDSPPQGASKSSAYPYIVVPMAKVDEKPLTMTCYLDTITTDIEIVSTKNENVRKVADVVRECLRTNRTTHDKKNMWRFINSSTSYRTRQLEDNAVEHTAIVSVVYEALVDVVNG